MADHKSWTSGAHCTSYRQLDQSEYSFWVAQLIRPSVSYIHLSWSLLSPGCFPCLSVSELPLLLIHAWERMDLVNLVSCRDSQKPLDCLLLNLRSFSEGWNVSPLMYHPVFNNSPHPRQKVLISEEIATQHMCTYITHLRLEDLHFHFMSVMLEPIWNIMVR